MKMTFYQFLQMTLSTAYEMVGTKSDELVKAVRHYFEHNEFPVFSDIYVANAATFAIKAISKFVETTISVTPFATPGTEPKMAEGNTKARIQGMKSAIIVRNSETAVESDESEKASDSADEGVGAIEKPEELYSKLKYGAYENPGEYQVGIRNLAEFVANYPEISFERSFPKGEFVYWDYRSYGDGSVRVPMSAPARPSYESRWDSDTRRWITPEPSVA